MSEVKLMRWFAHVLSSAEGVKTCRVHFYVEDPRVSNKYIRENIGRMSVETIIGFHYLDCTWVVAWYILA